MRIVIDMQGAQVPGRPEIVHFTLTLARTMIQQRASHEILLALSDLSAGAVMPVRTAFEGLLAPAQIRVWCAPGPMDGGHPEAHWRRAAAELIREAFLASLRPDVVLVPYPLAGAAAPGVFSVGKLTADLPTVVLLESVQARMLDRMAPDAAVDTEPDVIASLRRADGCVVWEDPLLERVFDRWALRPPDLRFAAAEGPTSKAAIRSLLEFLAAGPGGTPSKSVAPARRITPLPRLAYVSPLPPQRSGISDYSAELLPELARFYEIDVIVAQEGAGARRAPQNWAVGSPRWFRDHADVYDRVVYHFGNSPFHLHMFDLLPQAPGVVVLHDFFYGDIQRCREHRADPAHAWSRALYQSHGYRALAARWQHGGEAAVLRDEPANFEVLQPARGVIVHSEYARQLAAARYGERFADDWAVIPMLRRPAPPGDRQAARRALGLQSEDFLVCSFGVLGPTKCNHRLLDAWLRSALAADRRCALVFVGENDSGAYGRGLSQSIEASALGRRLRITGWVSSAAFRNYLAAADLAVQLRTRSRGETSAAVLDCMNHGLPTVVNAHGAFAELPGEAVWMLADDFETGDLTAALETLWQDPKRRRCLGQRARDHIAAAHAPADSARRYHRAIEAFYRRGAGDTRRLMRAIAAIGGAVPSGDGCRRVAQAVARSLPPRQPARRLLVDISADGENGIRGGMDRSARALLRALLEVPPAGFRIEPVYLNEARGWRYRYARRDTLTLLGCPVEVLGDEVVEPAPGDVLLGLVQGADRLTRADAAGLLEQYRRWGVRTWWLVHDLLPVRMPRMFSPAARRCCTAWLRVVAQMDGVVCPTRTVAADLADWLKDHAVVRSGRRPPRIAWSPPGADSSTPPPGYELSVEAAETLERINARPSFLMVGEIAPHTGHLQTIMAFERLWERAVDVNLVIVEPEESKARWSTLMRHADTAAVSRLRAHPLRGERLFWLSGIDDGYMEKIYAGCACLVAASEGEGFGLPLIEAARHGLPLIARDIPVFREVAGTFAHFFADDKAPEALAGEVRRWLGLFREGRHPTPEGLPWLTWQDSARRLTAIVLADEAPPDGRCRPSV